MKIENKLFSQILTQSAADFQDCPAITCEDRTITYNQLKLTADRFALKLAEAGLKKGDRVILWGMNSIEWAVAFFGIVQAGGTAVLVNYGLKADNVSLQAKMVDASWGIIGNNSISLTDPEAAVEALHKGGLLPEHIFPISFLSASSALIPLSEEEQKTMKELAARTQPKDTQVIIFTSGTSSVPKAVQLSSFSILSNVEGFSDLLGKSINERICLALPTFHSYGLMVLHLHLAMGRHLFVSPQIKPDILIKMIFDHNITDMWSVGAIYGKLTTMPEFERKLYGQLKFCVVGGGLTTPAEMIRFEKLLGGGKMICGYGQTECSPVISVETYDDPLDKRAVSVGYSLPNLEVRIWNEDSGFAAQDEVGEIVVKGPSLMNGYYGLPEEAQPIDRDGWLHTGDLGRFTPDGMLHFVGRIKDIIIRGGENIAPSEIEQVLLEQPEVCEAKVLGVPHEIWGESVGACMVLRQPIINIDEFRSRLKAKLDGFKIPAHFLVFNAFPLNENGKLNQRALKQDMMERLLEINLTEALNNGVQILDIRLKNKRFSVKPCRDMIRQLAEQIDFDEGQIDRLCLSAEKMLISRIEHAFELNGTIRLEVLLMPRLLRLRFTDNGSKSTFEGEDISEDTKLILANVDSCTFKKNAENDMVYCLDYRYREGFNVRDYLMKEVISLSDTGTDFVK